MYHLSSFHDFPNNISCIQFYFNLTVCCAGVEHDFGIKI